MYLGPVQLFLHGKIATQGPSLSVKPWVLLLSVLTPSLRKEDDGDAGDERDRYSVLSLVVASAKNRRVKPCSSKILKPSSTTVLQRMQF